jgi:hypothetical protein
LKCKAVVEAGAVMMELDTQVLEVQEEVTQEN